MKKQQVKKKNIKKLKKVLVFGTFDGIHKGHLFFLKKAKKLGRLFISISSDKNVSFLKKRKLSDNEIVRKRKIEKIMIANKVIVGDKKIEKWNVIKKIKPDIIALGYDQKKLKVALKRIEKIYKFKIIIIKSYKPKIYKSSLIFNKKNA